MDPSMFFQPIGPSSPRLIGPVMGEMSGFPKPLPDHSMQLRTDVRGAATASKVNRSIVLNTKPLGKKLVRWRTRAHLLRHKEIKTIPPLKVGDENAKPQSPRNLEHGNAFDALEYSSPKYFLEKGSHSPRKLPGPHARGEQFKVSNEALEVLEDTSMEPMEPTSAVLELEPTFMVPLEPTSPVLEETSMEPMEPTSAVLEDTSMASLEPTTSK